MRSLDESRRRWAETTRHSDSVAELQRAVKFDGPTSPCEAGCRSVCWKTFLLGGDASPEDRLVQQRSARADYDALCARHLQFIRQPEKLAELTVDPLADDPESPWDTFRRDEAVRAEILQDVRRLPDDALYHETHIQTLILDVLFVYFKQHPDAGGYRQGMHELLAPIVCVLDRDALDSAGRSVAEPLDQAMAETLDSRYLEHDAYALFCRVMAKAQGFYEIRSGRDAQVDPLLADDPLGLSASASAAAGGAVEESTIVEMSRAIHEDALMKVDPELATHLKAIEILPQIFLIRWIRLLFGREFPFDQLLVLWDSLFALDPDFDLVPLICVAMLLRIRWELVDADYAVALPLLLKYPSPPPPHGPHTFVEDAVYLRDHLSVAGGTSLILKYTGRAPAPLASPVRPSTPTSALAAGLDSLRQRTRMGARSPLGRDAVTSPSRFAQRREGLDALFQGAAKGVLERGEKLGINQAVRDAVGDIRRNMVQGLQEARQAAKARSSAGAGAIMPGSFVPSRPAAAAAAAVSWSGPKRRPSTGQAVRALAEMEARNRQLATMLDETVESLKAVVVAAKDAAEADKGDGKGDAWLDAVEIAAAKVQFVKVHLEDASLAFPNAPAGGVEDTGGAETDKNGAGPLIPAQTPPPDPQPPQDSTTAPPGDDRMDTDEPLPPPASKPPPPVSEPPAPAHTIPSRATLAQSSFAWMLEPGDTPAAADSTSTGNAAAAKRNGGVRAHPPGTRSRHAFLFGEVVGTSPLGSGGVDGGGSGGGGGGSSINSDPLSGPSPSQGADGRSITADEIFGLEPLRRALPKTS